MSSLLNFPTPSYTPPPPTSLEGNLEAFYEHVDKLEHLNLSEEGMKLFMLTTVDLFGRLANNLKTLLIKWPRSLKRSELRAFTESNITRLAMLERLPYDQFNERDTVHMPADMTCRYVDAWEYLSRAYNTLDVVAVLKANVKLMDKAFTLVQRGKHWSDVPNKTRGKQDFIKEVRQLLTLKHRSNVGLATDPSLFAAKEAENIFSQTATDNDGTVVVKDEKNGRTYTKALFRQQFESVEQYRQFRLNMLSHETRLIEVSKINGLMEQINYLARRILDYYNQSEAQHDRDTLQSISTHLRMLAELVSYYGYCASVHITFEHNYCLSAYDLIRAKL